VLLEVVLKSHTNVVILTNRHELILLYISLLNIY